MFYSLPALQACASFRVFSFYVMLLQLWCVYESSGGVGLTEMRSDSVGPVRSLTFFLTCSQATLYCWSWTTL